MTSVGTATGHTVRTPVNDSNAKAMPFSPFVASASKHQLSKMSSPRSGYSGEDRFTNAYEKDAAKTNAIGLMTSSPAGLVDYLHSAPAWRGGYEKSIVFKGQSDDPFVSGHDTDPKTDHSEYVLTFNLQPCSRRHS